MNPIGWILSNLSHPLAALLLNMYSTGQYQEAEDKFQQEIEAGNIQMQDVFAEQLGIGAPSRTATGEPGEYQTWKQAGLDEMDDTTTIGRADELGEQVSRLARESYSYDTATDRYRQATRAGREGLEDIPGQVEAGNLDIQAMLADTRAAFETDATSLLAGYEDRLARARGEVSTLGTSQRAEIDRIFDEELGRVQSDLLQRGFGGTLAASAGTGVAARRAISLGELEEQLARMRIGVEETFGGDVLGTEGELAQIRTGLGTTAAGFGAQGTALLANTSLGTYGTLANIGAGEYAAGTQSVDALIDSLIRGGSIPIEAREQAVAMFTGWQGGKTEVAPTPPNPAVAFPYGGG